MRVDKFELHTFGTLPANSKYLGFADEVEKFGIVDNLNTSIPTVLTVLKKAGYRVGHFGKWHLSCVGSPPPEAYSRID